MAYNVFKRPMFKRGGSTNGTGIMSHVEPRTNAANGFFGDLLKPATNPDGTPVMLPQRSFADDVSFLIGPGKFLKAGGAGLNILKQAGQFAKFPKGYPSRGAAGEGIEYLKYADKPGLFTNRGILEAVKPYTSGAYETLKTAGRGTRDFLKKYGVATGIGTGGGLGIYSLLSGDKEQLSEQQKVDLLNQATNQAANVAVETEDDPSKKPAKYEETDTRTAIQKEADEIMDVLRDEKLDKAEAALLVSKALKTPGSVSDKIEAAVTDAKSIAQRKSKEERSAKLLAYQTLKKEEEAPAAVKLSKRAAQLASKENLTKQEKNELENLRSFIEKETYTEKKISGAETDYYFANRGRINTLESSLIDFQNRINKGEKLDQAEQEQLKFDKQEYDYLKSIEQRLGIGAGVKPALKDGGRIGYAEGTEEPVAEGDIIATETAGDGNVVPMQPVEKLTYDELRNKLPPEITDDIVQLIANSEEALQDFAYIGSQNDINQFNVKYGVNLVLPPQKG